MKHIFDSVTVNDGTPIWSILNLPTVQGQSAVDFKRTPIRKDHFNKEQLEAMLQDAKASNQPQSLIDQITNALS